MWHWNSYVSKPFLVPIVTMVTSSPIKGARRTSVCGHPFPHYLVGVILKGLKPSTPSPPRRFPSDVKEVSARYYYTQNVS